MLSGVHNKLDGVKNVAIYLRKSRKEEEQEDDEALSNHYNILKRIVVKNKWKYQVYKEIASSINMDIRTELTKMLNDVRDGIYDAVLVMDEDRLSRSVKDSAIIKAILAENDVLIITADMKVIDLNEDNDSLMSDFMDVLSSYEYKQIRKRMLRGKREGARKGKFNNGVAPIGYKLIKDTQTLEIIEEEARIVRLIFKWTIEGIGTTEIATKLNRLGFKTKNNSHFRTVSIRRILKNEIYKGWLIRHRIKWVGNKREYHPKDNWIIVKDTFPEIVSEEDWDKANAKLKEREVKPTRARRRTFGLTGLVKCGYCGSTLTIRKREDRKTDMIVRGCHTKYPDGDICPNSSISYYIVMETLMSKLQDYEKRLVDNIDNIEVIESNMINENKMKIDAINDQIKKNTRAIKRVDMAWEEEIIEIDEYRTRRKELLTEKEELESELEVLEANLENPKTDDYKMTLERLRNFLHDYNGMNHKQLNESLSILIKEIILYNNLEKESHRRIEVVFN